MPAFFVRTIVAAAALAAAPSLLRAQALIRASAVVSSPQTFEIRRDTARVVRRDALRLPGGLTMRVDAGAGSVVRALPADSSRTVRLVVDYVGS